MEVKIQALFCDHVRRDAEGTFILIGVYPGIIFLEKDLGKTVNNFIQINDLPAGKHKVRLHVTFEPKNGGDLVTMAKQSTSIHGEDDMDQIAVVLTPMGLELGMEEEGKIRLFIGIDDDDEIEVASLVVKLFEHDPEEGQPETRD
ncbi:hypothetical protein [Ensifer sp. 1H6]|uniref:hypothetical protein n=1 Tax=Ensifer sp. 1H6 TaxID=1911585 RepID=UPI0009D37C14|nr:hypothetical protein [Ensifer sp. 1H6]OMQ42073.1 hypothetical protein BKP54_25370 [Ensifer sp. 1H6]